MVKFPGLLWMLQKSCEKASWGNGGLSVYPSSYSGFIHPFGGWPWDIWTINSMSTFRSANLSINHGISILLPGHQERSQSLRWWDVRSRQARMCLELGKFGKVSVSVSKAQRFSGSSFQDLTLVLDKRNQPKFWNLDVSKLILVLCLFMSFEEWGCWQFTLTM